MPTLTASLKRNELDDRWVESSFEEMLLCMTTFSKKKKKKNICGVVFTRGLPAVGIYLTVCKGS